jgi:hypothetical protein
MHMVSGRGGPRRADGDGILPTEDTMTAFATANDASVSSKVLLRFEIGTGQVVEEPESIAPAEDALDDLQAVSAESPRSSPQHRGDGVRRPVGFQKSARAPDRQ